MATAKKKPFPWWVSILAAIAVYCGLKYLLPGLHPKSEGLRIFFELGPTAAPVATIPFLLLAAKQLYDTVPEEEENSGEEVEGPAESRNDRRGSH